MCLELISHSKMRRFYAFPPNTAIVGTLRRLTSETAKSHQQHPSRKHKQYAVLPHFCHLNSSLYLYLFKRFSFLFLVITY